MDIAHLRPAGMRLLMADEALPQVLAAAFAAKDALHDRFRAVAVRLKHFAHAALVAKTHNNETARRIFGSP